MNIPWKKIYWWLEMLVPIIIAFPFMFKFVYIDKNRPSAGPCLAVTIITAAYWIFEPIPIVITAFIPIFLLPFFTVSTGPKIAASMFTDTSIVFIGGFIFSIAMVKWNLHSRIALKTVCIFGLRPNILLFGILVVTTLLSFWISNTACALTMTPNAIAIITKLEEITGDPEAIAPFGKALLLMIAMTCSAAGMITLIGTPPNLILAQTVQNLFPGATEIGFAQFMFVSLPVSMAMLIPLYIFFVIFYTRKVKIPDSVTADDFKKSYEKLGKWSPAEIIITVMFCILACMWLFRSNIDFGKSTMKGWSTLIYGSKGSSYIKDGTIAIFLAILFYIIHVPPPPEKKEGEDEVDLELRAKTSTTNQHRNNEEEDGELDNINDTPEEDIEQLSITDSAEPQKEEKKWVPILDWEYTQQKMPWTILFLFSGGFALNQGFNDSGLDVWIGERLGGLTNMSLYPLVLVITCTTILMTNIVASNTAVANILLPIVASVAKSSGKIHPFLLIFPIAFACSYCFIMPVATPPNLIAYSTGRLKTLDFIIVGTFLTVVAIIVVPPLCVWIIPPVFNAGEFPAWANASSSTS